MGFRLSNDVLDGLLGSNDVVVKLWMDPSNGLMLAN